MLFGIVSMRVAVNEVAMNVRMRVRDVADARDQAAGVNVSVIQRVNPVRFKIPSRINISPTDNSMVRPRRGGITTRKE